MQPQTPLLFHGFSLVWTLLIALFKNGIFHDIKLSGFIKSIEFCSVQLHVHLQMEIYECYSFYLIFFDTSTYYIPFLPFLGCIYVCMVNFAYYVLNLWYSSIIFQYHIHPSTLWWASSDQIFAQLFMLFSDFHLKERSLLFHVYYYLKSELLSLLKLRQA